MRSGTGIVVVRGIIAALLASLGAVQLMSGRVVSGVLLLALAATSVTLTVLMARRRRAFQAKYPGLAQRRREGVGPTP